MNLKDITTDIVWQAITSYVEVAYPDGTPEHVMPAERDFLLTRHAYPVLGGVFTDESHWEGRINTRRFVLRLGNHAYPHMKLVLAEFLEHGQFFFFVDAHDQVPIPEDSPDYPAWKRIKCANAAIKDLIEDRWDYLGVPTFRQLKKLVARKGKTDRIDRPKTILVVDDNRFIAAAVQQILSQKGFMVYGAEDGESAIRMAQELHPDLIILDYQMPRLDGGQVCAHLKDDERCCNIPIILATTTPIEFIGDHRADGFLVKPFDRRVLLSFVEHFLANAAKKAADANTERREAEKQRPLPDELEADAQDPSSASDSSMLVKAAPAGGTSEPAPKKRKRSTTPAKRSR